MRKLTKAISALILLSLVLSAFAGFSIFAADEADQSSYFTTIYDMDSKSSVSIKNVGDKYPNYPSFKKTTVDGQPVFTQTMASADGTVVAQPGEAGNSQDFWEPLVGYNTVRVRDNTSTVANIGGTKNTDFLIVDFDIATETEFIDDIYFNTRFLQNTSTAYNKGHVTGQPTIKFGRNDDGSLFVGSTAGDKFTLKDVERYKSEDELNNKWTHVTYVYDFHPTAFDAEGNAVDVANRCYVYLDGYYAGELATLSSAVTTFYFFRVQTIEDDKVKTANTSTSFANFTVKKVATGYTGELTEGGVLGNIARPLGSIDDLSYCVEDAIEAKVEPAAQAEDRLASIKRGDEIIDCYDFHDLSGDLKDGDVVTLYGAVGGYVAIKDGVNVTWQNPDGSAADAPNTVTIAADSDWAVVKADGTIVAEGKSDEASYTSEGNVSIDPMHLAVSSATKASPTIYFFGDYTSYGRGATGSSVTKAISPSSAFTYDLNGNALTVNTHGSSYHYISFSGAYSVKVVNGTFNYNGNNGANFVYFNPGVMATLKFEDVTLNHLTGVLIDQRGGNTVFDGCTISTIGNISSVKSGGGANKSSSIKIVDSELTVTTSAAAFESSNFASSGKRYGSAYIDFHFVDSVFKAKEGVTPNFISMIGYLDQVGTYITNNNNFRIMLDGVEALGFNYIVALSANSQQGKNAGDYTHNNIFAGIGILNSTLGARSLLYVENTGIVNVTDAESGEVTDAGYTENIGVAIKDSKLDLKEAGKSGGITRITGSAAEADVSVYLYDGVVMYGDSYTWGSSIVPEIKLENADSKFVHTALYDGYGYILSPNYDAYTYQLGNEAPVEFLWNKAEGEAVNPSKVVALADTEIYSYTWAQDGNAFTAVLDKDFIVAAMSNLSLLDDISYNVYFSAEEYAKYGQYIIVKDMKGNALVGETVELDGESFVKFSAANIAPTNAEDTAITVTIAFDGAYGDTYSASHGLTLLGYTETIIAGGDAKKIAFIDAILNYISAAYTVAGKDNANVNALISADASFATEIEGEAKLDSREGIEVALNYGTKLHWGVKATAAATVTIEYISGGNAETKTVELAEGERFFLALNAYDMINSIKVNGAEVNLKGYYEALTDDNAKAMVLAIYNYVKAAADYKAA